MDPMLKKLGGGARDLEVRLIESSPVGPFLVVHLVYDVRDAMGANAVNTAVERLAPWMISSRSAATMRSAAVPDLRPAMLLSAWPSFMPEASRSLSSVVNSSNSRLTSFSTRRWNEKRRRGPDAAAIFSPFRVRPLYIKIGIVRLRRIGRRHKPIRFLPSRAALPQGW